MSIQGVVLRAGAIGARRELKNNDDHRVVGVGEKWMDENACNQIGQNGLILNQGDRTISIFISMALRTSSAK